MLHDIDVKDGLAYLSYWNDGLVILDVGKGIKGAVGTRSSSPSTSTDLNALYRDVEAVGDRASFAEPTPPGAQASMSSWEMKSSLPSRGLPKVGA
jgi:hypothetical protein